MPFTAKIRTDVFLQWNSLNQDGNQEFDTQVRFRLVYARDSNLFVVFTDQRLDRGNGRRERDQAIQMKLTYRFYQ